MLHRCFDVKFVMDVHLTYLHFMPETQPQGSIISPRITMQLTVSVGDKGICMCFICGISVQSGLQLDFLRMC